MERSGIRYELLHQRSAVIDFYGVNLFTTESVLREHPARAAALRAATREEALEIEPWLTRDDFRRFKWIREAESEFQPFHQRNWFAAHPDLSYAVLNGDQPLKTSPHQEDGVLERMLLIRNKLPGVEEAITQVPPQGAGQLHLLQAAGFPIH